MSNDATDVTRAANNAVLGELPFDDLREIELVSRGLIEAAPDLVIRDTAGRPVWNMQSYAFLDGPPPATVNPSLWRRAVLNAKSGLFKVTDGIYQVRGYDISNVTFVETPTGIIAIDPLLSVEVAEAALALYYKHRPRKPIIAVIYTHTHVDHFGGVRGLVNDKQVASGEVEIIAPEGFMRAVSESVAGGNAIARRATYMFGSTLAPGVTGHVDVGIGKTVSSGTVSLIPPTVDIGKTGQEIVLGGVRIVFQLTPDAEAPAEMDFYLPDFNALCMAENANATLHNVYTLRGSPIRDAKAWSRYLNEAVQLFGAGTEVMFTSHFFPRWGRASIVDFLTKHADAYKYVHDQTMRLANQGHTMLEIAEILRLPDTLAREWYNRGYYGTVSHNSKAVYQRYFGFFDGNPASLHQLPPEEAGRKYVEFMGGTAAVIEKATRAQKAGEYRWVAQVMSHVVFAEPDNQEARTLAADALEQMGYQAEASTWRNFYLTGAAELRDGVRGGPPLRAVSPDIVAAMPLDMYFEDYLSVRLNAEKAEGTTVTLRWQFTDISRQCTVVLRNSVLNYFDGAGGGVADATITLARALLTEITLGRSTFRETIRTGEITVAGDTEKAIHFFSLFEKFEFWFNVVTP